MDEQILDFRVLTLHECVETIFLHIVQPPFAAYWLDGYKCTEICTEYAFLYDMYDILTKHTTDVAKLGEIYDKVLRILEENVFDIYPEDYHKEYVKCKDFINLFNILMNE